jgi:hypothetical protein
MSRRTVEFEANEAKDWMFHCHILYHMMSGMARVFRYEDEPEAPKQKLLRAAGHVGHHSDGLGEHKHEMRYFLGGASVQSHMSEGLLTLMNPQNDLLVGWEAGWQGVGKTEMEVDVLYQRYLHRNFQVFAGGRFTNDSDARNRTIAGFTYRLPLMVSANVSLDSEGDARMTLGKRFQVTPRLGVWGRVEYDTNTRWEWTGATDYTLTRNTSLIAQYHSQFGFGAGLLFRF